MGRRAQFRPIRAGRAIQPARPGRTAPARYAATAMRSEPSETLPAPHPAPLPGFSAAGRRFEFPGTHTYVMGVVNLSPESRVAHSVVASPAQALERARQYRELGAAIIDLGAQSSHYENAALSPDAELRRLLPALELLVDDGFVVAVDTWKPAVASAALAHGAAIVNDTGGMQDPEMVRVVAAAGAAAVLMHIEGRDPLSVGAVGLSAEKASEVAARMQERLARLAAAGVDTSALLLDPGLSINYRSDYAAYSRLQMQVVRDLGLLRALGHPVLVPVPRKAQAHRMLAYMTLALEYGADVVRVHDVELACDLVELFDRTAPPS